MFHLTQRITTHHLSSLLLSPAYCLKIRTCALTGNSCYLEASPIFDYMYKLGCSKCDLCAGDVVVFPNATVDYFGSLGYYDLQCYQIEFAIGNGYYLTEENCTAVQAGLAGVCCGKGPATLAPAFVVPDEPGSAPPGAAPSAPPVAAGTPGLASTMAGSLATSAVVLMSGIAAVDVVW